MGCGTKAESAAVSTSVVEEFCLQEDPINNNPTKSIDERVSFILVSV
jgi:hypothetical protein